MNEIKLIDSHFHLNNYKNQIEDDIIDFFKLNIINHYINGLMKMNNILYALLTIQIYIMHV
mgnify:CR=1 FL=1